MTKLKFYILILFTSTLFACDGDAGSSSETSIKSQSSDANEYRVTSVNDFEFLFNDTDEGGIINFQSNAFQQCSLSFIKKKLVAGYETQTTQLGKGDLDLTCLTENDNFALDDSDATYVKVKVLTLDKTATLILNFSLIGFNSETLIEREKVTLSVNSKQLQTLLSNSL